MADNLHYSQTQPPQIAALMAAMPDGGAVTFRSAVAGASGEIKQWLQAVRNPIDQSWTVIQHNEPGSSTAPSFQEPVLSGACFFDALHYCARFDSAAAEFSDTASEADVSDIPHYRTAAALASLPLDTDGFPHPAANGAILTGGSFDENARKIARQTKDLVLIAPANKAPSLSGLLKTNLAAPTALIPAAGNEDFLSRNLKKIELLSTFSEISRPLDDFYKFIANEIGKNNKPVPSYSFASPAILGGLGGVMGAVGGVLAAMFFAPVSPLFLLPFVGAGTALGAGGGVVTDYNERQGYLYKPREKKFSKAIDGLPEGAEKNNLREFHDTADCIYSLTRVRGLFNKCVAGGESLGRLRKIQNQGLKILDDTAARLQWRSDEREALKTAFRNGQFPDMAPLKDTLDSEYRKVRLSLAGTIEKLRVS